MPSLYKVKSPQDLLLDWPFTSFPWGQHGKWVSSQPWKAIFLVHLTWTQAESALIYYQSALVGIWTHPDVPEGSCFLSGQMTDNLTLKTHVSSFTLTTSSCSQTFAFTGAGQEEGRERQKSAPSGSLLLANVNSAMFWDHIRLNPEVWVPLTLGRRDTVT